MSIADVALREQYIIQPDQISSYCSPEAYQITDPESGVTWVYYNGEPIVELGHKRALDNAWVHPEPKYTFGRCKMIKADGERCRQPVRHGWSVCKYHGAGTLENPAGRPPVSGNYSSHLPTRYMADFESYMTDPNLLSMRKELALLDVRMGELLSRLETADAPLAWNKVAMAAAMLEKMLASGKTDALCDIIELMRSAIDIHKEDRDTWNELVNLIDKRRGVADVERRRIEAAKKYLTMQEANAMMAFLINSVMKHVSSPQERARISEDLRSISGSRSGP